MKEKLNQAKEWIKANKKRSAGIAVAILLIIGAIGIGIAGVNNNVSANPADNNKKVSSEEKDTNKTVTKKPKIEKKTEDETEATDKDVTNESDTAKTEEKNTMDAQQADNAAAASSNTNNTVGASSSGSSSSSAGGGSSQESSHTHSFTVPVYGTEQRWVVDQAAWTETVSEPIYENKLVWYCNTCGADITADPEGHVDATMHGGYRSDYISVQTGTNTYTIDHPEQGHWESYSVVAGYQCSCGAVQ